MSAKEAELAQAAMRNELQTMERLIAEGVSADAKDERETPALVLAARGGHLDALKLLRRHGANLEATHPTCGMYGGRERSKGYTALMAAANYDKADCAEALLEWGADKDAADDDGMTALHIAAYGGLEIARLLVEAQVDRAKKNKKGQTALDCARQGGRAEVAALLEQADADVRTPALLQSGQACGFFALLPISNERDSQEQAEEAARVAAEERRRLEQEQARKAARKAAQEELARNVSNSPRLCLPSPGLVFRARGRCLIAQASCRLRRSPASLWRAVRPRRWSA